MPDPIPIPSGIQIHSPSLGEGGETTPYQGSRLWDPLTLKSSQTHTDLLPLPSLPQNPRTPPGPQTHTLQGQGLANSAPGRAEPPVGWSTRNPGPGQLNVCGLLTTEECSLTAQGIGRRRGCANSPPTPSAGEESCAHFLAEPELPGLSGLFRRGAGISPSLERGHGLTLRASFGSAAPHITSVLSQCSLEPSLSTPSPPGLMKPGYQVPGRGSSRPQKAAALLEAILISFFKLPCSSWDKGGTRVGGLLVTMGGGGVYLPTPRAHLRGLLLVADVVLME